ncbi:MAG: hypothetical protein U0R26_10635 [Solirubrobacterales bacterium]
MAGAVDPVEARRVARYLWVIVALAIVITCVLLATVSTLIPLFFGDEFTDSVELSYYILLAGAFFRRTAESWPKTMRGRGQPGAGTVAEIVATIWLVVAMVTLVPLLGVIGVAVALASSQVASLALLAVIAVRRGGCVAAKPLRAFADCGRPFRAGRSPAQSSA